MNEYYYQYNYLNKIINSFEASSGSLGIDVFDFNIRIPEALNYMLVDCEKIDAISNVTRSSALTKIKCLLWSFTGIYRQDEYPNKRQRWLVFTIKRMA